MSRIYEAIMRAEEERASKEAAEVVKCPSAPGVTTKKSSLLSDGLRGIYQTVQALETNRRARIVAFADCQAGDSASVLVREFAKLCCMEFGAAVALIDGKKVPNGRSRHFGIGLNGDCDSVTTGKMDFHNALHPVGDLNLQVGAVSLNGISSAAVMARPEFDGILEQLRRQFDLTLLDAPPAAEGSGIVPFAQAADGVVLVVEAEKTRWQVAQRAKQRIEDAGGRLLGVILNNRRFHIPRVIYDRL